MKRLPLILLSAALLLCGCSAKGDNNMQNQTTAGEAVTIPAAETDAPPETEAETALTSEASEGKAPVMRFAVASDVHYKEYDSIERQRFADLFKDSYAYCESQSYKSLDAVVIVGDFTDSGSSKQYAAFNETWQSNIKDETQMIVVMGNHEWGSSSYADFEKKMSMEPNSDNVVKGFHLIGLSPLGGGDYTGSYDWLDEHFTAAVNEDPEKPIFTFQHHHIRDTVYVSEEWYTDQLDDIYRKYPQNINFSGHSHGPVNDPRSLWQGKYTALGTGTLSYFEFLSGMTYGTIPSDAGEAAQFYIVEVFADNSVKILPYNLLTHDFFDDPSDYSDAKMEWIIDRPSDASSFRYNQAARKKAADKPLFPDNTPAPVISDIGVKTATISFTQATDGECVYSYEIAVYKKGSSAAFRTYNIFSGYYIEPRPQTLSYTMGGLNDLTEYEVRVTAVDCFGKRGENFISAAFTTKEGEPFVPNTGSGGQFKGTFTDFESYAEFKRGDCFVYNETTGDGDYWMGAWDSGSESSGSKVELAEGKGYNGSAALAVSENGMENQGLYLYANSRNNNLNSFKGAKYLRVWMDLTGLDFRKANFGVFDCDGNLFTTDESDGYPDLEFFYLPEGETKWQEYLHGGDGCFGDAQDSSVKDFKGWFAFPIEDFTIRGNANSGGFEAGATCDLAELGGVYMFWDYSDSADSGSVFYLDEISLVADYTAFDAQ